MYSPRNNGPFGYSNRNNFGSRFPYQALPYGVENNQAGSLISKVMSLLAFSFLFAAAGAFIGINLGLGRGISLIAAIAGFVILIALNFLIERPGVNLFLLYLFTFVEGLSLSALLSAYLTYRSDILAQAFVLTALTSLGLAVYAWTTKHDFTRLGDYLFFGLILLLVASIVGIFFRPTIFALIISVGGVAIFSGYVLYYVQRAKYMADTMPNAIGLTVSLFITVLNLFLYILQLLSILQGNRD